MKKLIIFSLILAFSFAACKKKYTCNLPVYYLRPVGVIFKGYDSTAVSSFEILRYAGDSNFGHLLSRDTIQFSDLNYINGDIVFTIIDSFNYSPFFTLEDGVDYKVNIYKAGDVHTITGTKSGPPYIALTSDEPCDKWYKGQSNVTTLENIHVDSQPVSPIPGDSFGVEGDKYYIAISK